MRGLALSLGGLLIFASLARAAHDLWAATFIHLFVLALVTAVLFSTCWRPRGPGFPSAFLLPAALMAAAFSLSYSGAVNPSESFHALMDWLAAIGLFLAALAILRSDEAVETFLPAIVPILWIQLAVNLYQQSFGDQPLFDQMPGTLVNPNVAAGFLLAWLPVLFDRARRAAPLTRWFWVSGLAANFLSFALVHSLWGWLCLIAMTPFIVGPRRILEWSRRHRRTSRALLAAVLLSASSAVVWKFSHTRDFSGNPVPRGETNERADWWASGLDMFADHPWLGIGVGNYPSALRAYKVGNGHNTLSAHSFPIELAAGTGVMGFLCVMGFFGWWLLRLRRDWPRLRERAPFALGLAALLVYSTMSLSLEYLANKVVCALFLGLLAAPGAKERVCPPRSAQIVLACLALFLVPALLAPWTASRNAVEGERRLRAGDAAGALSVFGAAAELDPNSFAAHRGLAKARYAEFAATGAREALDAAVFHQRETIRLNGLIGLFWWELGAYLEASGAKEEAVVALARARKLTRGAAISGPPR